MYKICFLDLHCKIQENITKFELYGNCEMLGSVGLL